MPEDRGKRPQLFTPVPESPPSPSAGAAFPVLELRLVRLGTDPVPGNHAVAPQNPRQKRRSEDSGPAPSSPEFRIPAARWQYRRPTTTPPTGAVEGQGQPKAPRPAPAPEPSAPVEPGLASAAAWPGPADTTAETGLTDAAGVPGPTDTATEPVDAMSLLGPTDVAAEKGLADAAAETETQPPERPTPSEPAPRGWLEAAVAKEMARREAERAALAAERPQLAAARAANEDERRATEEGRKALEEARVEVTWERKVLEDTSMEVAREREEAARNRERAAEALQADLARQKS
ncbi:predicted GPI-anchored protein 58 [Phragmites australis]|uniref:predicted GPI-anchored protein 58 n=1 Tax=Phragmites australis TaxID=29695 RepID=UPI002D777F93|nr:predicted GPI-anchored protein 58 [Phragmites australis]